MYNSFIYFVCLLYSSPASVKVENPGTVMTAFKPTKRALSFLYLAVSKKRGLLWRLLFVAQ